MNAHDQALFDAWRAERTAKTRAALVPEPAAPAANIGPEPVIVDEQVSLPKDEETVEGWHLYEGLRARAFADPRDAEAVIVQMLGGQRCDPAFETDGIAFSITATGLTQLAADLVAIARARLKGGAV